KWSLLETGEFMDGNAKRYALGVAKRRTKQLLSKQRPRIFIQNAEVIDFAASATPDELIRIHNLRILELLRRALPMVHADYRKVLELHYKGFQLPSGASASRLRRARIALRDQMHRLAQLEHESRKERSTKERPTVK